MVTSAVWSKSHFDSRIKPLFPALFRHADKLAGPNDGPDCALEAAERAYSIFSRFDPDDDQQAFLCWLLRILENVCSECVRARAQRGEVLLPPEAMLTLAEEDIAPDISAEHRETLRVEIYRRLVEVALTPQQKLCLQRSLGGETHQEIADDLGISRRAVSYLIHRAVKRLRQGEEPEGDFWVVFWELCKVTVYRPPKAPWDKQAAFKERSRRRRKKEQDGPIGGTFTLTMNGQTSAPLPYNATATTVEKTLAGLGKVGKGN